MDEGIWTWLQEFQTGLAGLIGFAGVIITLLWNAKLSRDRVKGELEHSKATLRRALLVEVTLTNNIFKRNIELIENHLLENSRENYRLTIGRDVVNSVFNAHIDRVGLLDEDEIEKVLAACLPLENFENRLLLDGKLTPDSKNITFEGSNLSKVLYLWKGHVEALEEAIDCLSKTKTI